MSLSDDQREFIKSLADAAGNIEPASVVEAARDPDSPIHELFQWNETLAAQQQWVDTAKRLIRFVKLEIIIERETVIAPYYVVDPDRPPKSRRYLTLTTAARSRATAREVLSGELHRISQAISRALAVAAVLGMTNELQELLENVTALRERATEERAERRRTRRARPGGRRPPRGTPRKPRGGGRSGRRRGPPPRPELRT
jgi:hypothetical protein